jgi:acetyl esterase/lipase
MSPWTDLALTGESLRTRADADALLKPTGMPQTAALYLAGPDPRHPYASPLYADLHGLPPILIQVGDAEVVLDDSTRFAARARAAGVDVTLDIWDEMPHVFQAFAGLLPEADEAIAQIGGCCVSTCRPTVSRACHYGAYLGGPVLQMNPQRRSK